jgi:putative oxidoreductase
MKASKTIGRILFAIPFLLFGFFHFNNAEAMAGMMPPWMPIAIFFVYLSGLGLIGAGISIIIKVYTRLALQLLSLLLLLIILTMHLPGMMAGGEGAMLSMSMLLKDMGLMGAALFMSGQFPK